MMMSCSRPRSSAEPRPNALGCSARGLAFAVDRGPGVKRLDLAQLLQQRSFNDVARHARHDTRGRARGRGSRNHGGGRASRRRSRRGYEALPPAKTDVAGVVRRVHDRAVVWLRKHRYLDERPAEDRGNEPPAVTPVEGLARLALAGGAFLGRPFTPKDRADETLDRKEPRFSATYNGFDVHCAVRLAAEDDEGRERLLRYCARPPFALERIEELKDGRIAYAMKTPRRGSTHRVMTPVEFIGRLAILVPPPYFPLVRYHGVFAARSSWRALVTPKPPDGVARRTKPKPCSDPPPAAPTTSAPAALPARTTPQPLAPGSANAPASAAPILAPSALHALPIAVGDPTAITVKHWNRLLDGALFATSSPRRVGRPDATHVRV